MKANPIAPAGVPVVEQKTVPKAAEAADSAAQATPAGDSVSLSGYALMLSRLYGGADPSSMIASFDGGPVAAHLTGEDRALLARMYDYSVQNGIDLQHVDALATDLGSYRASPDTVRGADLYDLSGRKIHVAFSDTDQALAGRIAAAASTSELDQGYLQSRLIPGGRFANFDFLERMVKTFSSTPQDDHGVIGAYDPAKNRAVVTVEDEITMPVPVAHFESDETGRSWKQKDASSDVDTANAEILKRLNSNGGANRDLVTFLLGFARHEGTPANSFLHLLSAIPPTDTER